MQAIIQTRNLIEDLGYEIEGPKEIKARKKTENKQEALTFILFFIQSIR